MQRSIESEWCVEDAERRPGFTTPGCPVGCGMREGGVLKPGEPTVKETADLAMREEGGVAWGFSSGDAKCSGSIYT